MKLRSNAPESYQLFVVSYEVDGLYGEKLLVSEDGTRFELPHVRPKLYYDITFGVVLADMSIEDAEESVAAVTEEVSIRLHFGNRKVEVSGGMKISYLCRPEKWLIEKQASVTRLSGLGGGVIVMTNTGGGTDFKPIYLADQSFFEGKRSEKILEKYERDDQYKLNDTAVRLAKVFRVDRSEFNSQLDAEGLILNGMYRHVQDFNLMRSFAWTLAKRLEEDGKPFDRIDIDVIREVCAFIENCEGLNFSDGNVFGCLCGYADIHTTYVPKEIITSGLRNDFPPGAVLAPLKDLRQDLAALEPAMRLIYNELLKDRDRSKPLCYDDMTGKPCGSAMARVLYAWCAYAVAAAQPFFHEDGPRWFDVEYPDTPIESEPVPLYSGKLVLPTRGDNVPEEKPEDDGRIRVTFGQIDGKPCVWIALGRMENGELLLLTDRAEFCGSYGFRGANQWEGSDIQRKLNDEALSEMFTGEELAHVVSHDWPVRGMQEVEPNSYTTAKIIIPDTAEILALLPKAEDRLCKAGKHAVEEGLETQGRDGYCRWWLRCDPHLWAIRVNEHGNFEKWNAQNDHVIRPLILVDRETGDRLLNGARVPALKAGQKSTIIYAKEDAPAQTQTPAPEAAVQNPAPAETPERDRVQTTVQTTPRAEAPSVVDDPPIVSVRLQRGQRKPIDAGIRHLDFRFGWNATNTGCDVDVFAFMLNAGGKAVSDDRVIFYNQPDSKDGSIHYEECFNRVDREHVTVDLDKVDPDVTRIVFIVTMNNAIRKNVDFSMVSDSYVRILNSDTNREFAKYTIENDFKGITSMTFVELYLRKGEWRLNAVGNGLQTDFVGQCAEFGIDIAD